MGCTVVFLTTSGGNGTLFETGLMRPAEGVDGGTTCYLPMVVSQYETEREPPRRRRRIP